MTSNMNKRSFVTSSSSTSDVISEDKDDGSKVIIRQFELPRGPKKLARTKHKIQNLPMVSRTEKWKYLHDVPDGKIFTKRVHTGHNSGLLFSPIVSQPESCSGAEYKKIAKVCNPLQNVQVIKAPLPTVKLIPSPTKNDVLVVKPKDLVSNMGTSIERNVGTEKIVLNNLPDNIIAKSIKVVDSQYVNGKKIFYFKALKEANKSLGDFSKISSLQNGEEPKKNVGTIVDNSKIAFEPKVLKTYSSSAKKRSETKSDVLSNLQEAPVLKVNSTAPGGKLCVNVLSGTLVAEPKKSELQQCKSLPHGPHPIVQKCVSVPLQIEPGHLDTSTTRNVTNNGGGIKFLPNSTLVDIPVLNFNSSIQNTIESSGIAYKVLSGSSSKTSSISDGNLQVDTQSGMQQNRPRFILPSPFIPSSKSVPSSTEETSHNSTVDNRIPSEAIFSKGMENNVPLKAVSQVLHKSDKCSESKMPSRTESNVDIANNNKKIVNLSKSTKFTSKHSYEEMMKRRKLALMYQQDIKRNRGMPRIERTIVLPSRKVIVSDAHTQTNLFSQVEPGRMVEMFLNEDPNDSNSMKPSENKGGKHSHNIPVKDSTESDCNKGSSNQLSSTSNYSFQMKEKTGPPETKRMRPDFLTLNLDFGMDTIRSCQNTVNQDTAVSSSQEFTNMIHSPNNDGKENTIQLSNNMSVYYENKEKDLQNNIDIIDSGVFTSDESTQMSTVNCKERNNNVADIVKLMKNKVLRERLLKDYSSSMSIQDDDENLPIHNAVMDKDWKLVKRQCLVLLALKKGVDVKNKSKETPLHLAVLCHDLKMVELLLRHKARPEERDKEGNTALHMVIKWGNNNSVKILRALLTSMKDRSPILNIFNDEGYSPLHLCALHNKVNEADILLKKGADFNVRDKKSGRTPLFHAVESGITDLSRMLVNYGASTTIPNFSGQTPLNASEVTSVLDQLAKERNIGRTLSVLARCQCQHSNSEDEDICVSQGKNNIHYERNKNTMSSQDLNSLTGIFHNT